MTKLHRRSFASLLACTLAFSGAAAWAQSGYPAKPIRIVVPYAAGGPVDVTARIMAEPPGEVFWFRSTTSWMPVALLLPPPLG